MSPKQSGSAHFSFRRCIFPVPISKVRFGSEADIRSKWFDEISGPLVFDKHPSLPKVFGHIDDPTRVALER